MTDKDCYFDFVVEGAGVKVARTLPVLLNERQYTVGEKRELLVVDGQRFDFLTKMGYNT